jgi:hypothetical protein
MEFKIGDRVKVKEYANIPENHRTKGVARLHGEVGTVTDKLYSETNEGYIYRVHFDGYDRPSNKLWTEHQLYILIKIPTEYTFEFEYLENVVVAIFYEVIGDTKTEIARGHGHIIHQGALGIAQAASYALKKLYKKMNGGELV